MIPIKIENYVALLKCFKHCCYLLLLCTARSLQQIHPRILRNTANGSHSYVHNTYCLNVACEKDNNVKIS